MGSGKTTFYRLYLHSAFPTFVNADIIAAGLPDLSEAERSLTAAQLAERERNELIARRHTFAMETVFSRTKYWLDFLGRAKRGGYRIEIYFICTSDPVLNAVRVRERAAKGGHEVPLDRILKRFPGSLRTALEAKAMVDKLWLFDNSRSNLAPEAQGLFSEGRLRFRAMRVSRWARPFFTNEG